MPYTIERYKNGFRLKDIKGHYYSNKPMTKKAVIAQMKAIEMRHNQEGGGLKEIKQYITKTQKRLKDTVSNITGRITGAITGDRDSAYPPKVRGILNRYGNNNIIAITVRREPLSKAVEIGANILTLGQLTKSKKEAGYDDYFHLYLIATLNNNTSLLIEKNEVINIQLYNGEKDAGESYGVYMPNPIILNTFLDNALKGMGFNKFSIYDPLTANCQMFIDGLMTYNDLYKYNPNLKQFIMQDYRTLIKNLPTLSKKLARTTTDLARRINILTKGKGLFETPQMV